MGMVNIPPINMVMTGGWCRWHCFSHQPDEYNLMWLYREKPNDFHHEYNDLTPAGGVTQLEVLSKKWPGNGLKYKSSKIGRVMPFVYIYIFVDNNLLFLPIGLKKNIIPRYN